MKQDSKLPRSPQGPSPSPPRRPSHERVIENLDKWINSPGLQPPK
jgi:hypothetical protein